VPDAHQKAFCLNSAARPMQTKLQYQLSTRHHLPAMPRNSHLWALD